MRRVYAIIVYLLLASHLLQAQKTLRIDSLLMVLNAQQKKDSNRANTLNALVRQHWIKGAYKLADSTAMAAQHLSETIKFHAGIADAMYGRGVIQSLIGAREQALNHFGESLKISERHGYYKGIANAYNGIASLHYSQGRYTEAMQTMQQLIKVSKQNGDRQGLANYYNNIALIQNLLGMNKEAMQNNFESLRLKEALGDNKGMATSHLNIARIYQMRNEQQLALKHMLTSLRINEEIGSKPGIADNKTNIARTYMNLGEFKTAERLCNEAMQLYEKMGNKSGMAGALNTAGHILEKQAQYLPALQRHEASFNLYQELNDKRGISCTKLNMGEALFYLKQFKESRTQLNEGLLVAKQVGNKEDIKRLYQNLARLDSATGNWKGAYENHLNFIIYRDSLDNEATTKKITEAQLTYEFSRREDSLFYVQQHINQQLREQTLLAEQNAQSLSIKENQMSLLQSEAKVKQLELSGGQAALSLQKLETEKANKELALANNQRALQSLQLEKQADLRNLLLLVLGLLIALTIVGVVAYRSKQKLKLQTLRNKIASDLHDDVGSTLSSISIFSQMMKEQSKDVNPMLETIGDSSRKMLDAMADIVWTINPENDQFERIILRMRNFAYEMLGAKNIDFEFVASDEVSRMNLLMETRKNLYLIFKEAVNNMLKYSEADKAVFSITTEGKILKMLIEDNGKGFDPAQALEGNGLKNMRNRAAEMKGKLIITSFPGEGTKIELNIAV